MNPQFSERSFPTKEDAIEAEAFLSLHRISARDLRPEEHFDCIAISGGCAISLPGAPAIGLNRVLGLGAVEDLDQAYGWMRRRAGNRFLQLNMDTASDEVKNWIQGRDLHEHGPGWAKLTFTAAQRFRAPSPVRTRRVHVREASQFGSMMCSGFNFPPSLIPLWSAIVGKEGWGCFFALDGETPIGTGAIFTFGNYAWLGGGTTHPEFRNRGVQKALIQARTDYGIAEGISTFVVETEVPTAGKPNISYENLRKMGFEHAYDRKNFKFQQ
ncbi:GNAT family N-acetyltransferase [Rhizobium sp. RM]|uniref:GNAT family N-acetyltransferase n=1 Tax=Rhizobium sp. RM TaxID=2748079 RepID=UPI00110D967B|nr:GNAT family N-acetyltransferase [Rhizobium sp. RM]NWJ26367.1 GNAT family N-acetyltransferase [Rhizobium sp. RM]TMV19860.1 GNAT family N-acetyltransferase [Rhizobium sp. Td3]